MKWFRYVPHAHVESFLARGWSIDDDLSDTHHGQHAVLMIWKGEHEPR